MLIPDQDRSTPKHPYYGITVVSGTRGDLRQTPDGIAIYGNEGRQETVVPRQALEREAELSVLYDAWADEKPLASHDATWASTRKNRRAFTFDKIGSGLR